MKSEQVYRDRYGVISKACCWLNTALFPSIICKGRGVCTLVTGAMCVLGCTTNGEKAAEGSSYPLPDNKTPPNFVA